MMHCANKVLTPQWNDMAQWAISLGKAEADVSDSQEAAIQIQSCERWGGGDRAVESMMRGAPKERWF